MKKAFTLAEVLITLGIIGIVAAMTIPTLVQSYQEKQMVTGLQKFNSTLQQAVMLWKQDIDCTDDAYTCLTDQNLPDGDVNDFNQIAKFMRITRTTQSGGSLDWLADDTLDYYGNVNASSFGKVAKIGYAYALMLEDGTTFSMDVDSAGFSISVDVNGKKLPNRVGKDTFFIMIGKIKGKDIYYTRYWGDPIANGTCIASAACDPNITNPTIAPGANPTGYVIVNGKLPDFKALSQTVPGFKP